MNRKEYLELCETVAKIPPGIAGIKEVPEELTVMYNGVSYWPSSYEMRFDRDGNHYDVAVLHDLKANSVTHAILKNVNSRRDY